MSSLLPGVTESWPFQTATINSETRFIADNGGSMEIGNQHFFSSVEAVFVVNINVTKSNGIKESNNEHIEKCRTSAKKNKII